MAYCQKCGDALTGLIKLQALVFAVLHLGNYTGYCSPECYDEHKKDMKARDNARYANMRSYNGDFSNKNPKNYYNLIHYTMVQKNNSNEKKKAQIKKTRETRKARANADAILKFKDKVNKKADSIEGQRLTVNCLNVS